MKKIFFILIIFYCAFVNILAQEQSYCELLDTALVHYCRELDPDNECILFKNLFFHYDKPFVIEQDHLVKNYVLGKSRISFLFIHNVKKDDQVFDAPALYYQSDTLIVFCSARRYDTRSSFCFGSSVYSIFTYSLEDNKWHYSKSKTSELEFRLSDVYDELCKKCTKSVFDALSKESGDQIIHLKWTSEYAPRGIIFESDSIPSNVTFKGSRRTYDYAIGYPTVKFFGKQVEFSLKVIKRKDYKPNCFPKEGRTFSITVNIEDIKSRKIRGLK